MKKHLNASYALYLSLYWMSACFVYGYTRLFMSRLGFSADQVGLVLAMDCAAAMVLQPLLARVIERSARITMRHVLLGMCLVVLFCGGVLLLPQPKAVLICLFTAMSTMTMTIQPFVNAVGFDYINRGEKLNWSATRGVASLAFALISKVYAALAETDMRYLLELYLVITAGVLLCSLLLAGKALSAAGPRPQAQHGSLLKSYPAFFGMLLGAVLLFFQHNFLEAYLYDVIVAVGGDTPHLGTALLIGAAVETPMMFLFSRVEGKFGVNRVLRVSVCLMALKPWLILLLGSVWGVYLMRASHFFSFAPFLLSLTFYANGRMAEDEKVTAQALITGAISLSGVFSYLFGGMLVTVCGPLRALLLCTLIGMAGGALFLLFVQKDQQQAKA
ncbi:MAG: MFS transporter [Clostridia bacterium]|nr:MFS transporter [Clostridia bacterium]